MDNIEVTCACGCGNPTTISKTTNKYNSFVQGHNRKRQRLYGLEHLRCNDCGEVKGTSGFRKNSKSYTGYGGYCRTCRQVRQSVMTYQIPREDVLWYRETFPQCAICDVELQYSNIADRATFGHIDHDHTTGGIRGMLCGPCNMALGAFKDDRERLWRAMQYLGDLRSAPTN